MIWRFGGFGSRRTSSSEAGRCALPMRTGEIRTCASALSASTVPPSSATALAWPSSASPRLPSESMRDSGNPLPIMCPRTMPPRWMLNAPSIVPVPLVSVMLGTSMSSPR